MTAATKTRMSVNEYLAWARAHPGRYELPNGEVIAMSPEGAGHAAAKYAVQSALPAGIRARRLPCHMLPNGMTVRIDETTAYEPDALVYCGAKPAPSAVEVPAPAVMVELLPPSTRCIDAPGKLAGSFHPSIVARNLTVNPDKSLVVSHARASGETILTWVLMQGNTIARRDGRIRCANPPLRATMFGGR